MQSWDDDMDFEHLESREEEIKDMLVQLSKSPDIGYYQYPFPGMYALRFGCTDPALKKRHTCLTWGDFFAVSSAYETRPRPYDGQLIPMALDAYGDAVRRYGDISVCKIWS